MPPVEGPTKDKYDIVIIGGGSGGVACSRRASSYGAKVALVEVTNTLGGTCVNVGCVPKKIMWHAADLAEKFRHAQGYKFTGIGNPTFDWATFKPARDAYIRKLNDIYSTNLAKESVEHHIGFAKILSPTEVQVIRADNKTYVLKTDKICIASGGRPTIPSDKDIPGASYGIDSDRFFDLTEQPRRVAVAGAGYIGVELAGVFHALGTETHMMTRGTTVLRAFDPTIQETLTTWMEHTGIHFHKECQIVKVEKGNTGLTVITDKGKKVEVDVLLWAIGRHANTEGMGLEDVGVKLDETGNVVVDEYQNTSVPGITSIGDVQGKALLTPVAIAAGRRLANRLFGGNKFKNDKLSYEDIPSVVFSHPTIGSVGLTEPEARNKYGDAVKIYKTTFRSLYFSMIDEHHKEPTVYKLVVVGPEERIVGIHIIGQGSDEVMQGFAVALKMGARKADLDDTVAIHPTSAEELVTIK